MQGQIRRFLFGPFTLDPVSVELRRGTEIVPLRPRCYDLLSFFLANGGRLISKDELLREVWRGVIVDEGTINRTVTALRSALDDDAGSPRYIETVSRRGYKFIATVEGTPVGDHGRDEADLALVYKKRLFSLPDGQYLIGRGIDVAIPLYGSAISRHHARVTVSGATVTIEDLGSRNGTTVNGIRTTGIVTLQTGDEVGIGPERLILWSRSSETGSATD
jgi:DNA-binding winged helix-turn-helix (wHTH) protein